MAAVVSGAAVLEQSASHREQAQPPAEADRTAAMETKLDRIIEALNRVTGNVPASLNLAATLPPPDVAEMSTPAPEWAAEWLNRAELLNQHSQPSRTPTIKVTGYPQAAAGRPHGSNGARARCGAASVRAG